MADEVFTIGTVDVDVAVFTRFVVILFTVEPEDAGEDQILFFHWVGGFPDTASGFASGKVGAGFGVVADLLTDPMPAERGFFAVRFRACAFFGGGNRERAGDGAVIGNDIEALGGDGHAEMRHDLG